MALAGAMLAMFGLLSLILVGVLAGTQRGGGILSLAQNGDQAAAQQTQSTAAFNLAESGVEYTLQWLSNLSGPPALNHAFPLPAWNGNPGDPGSTYTLGDGSFVVTVFPDTGNSGTIILPNGQESPKRYLVQSTGTCNGVTQTVQAYVSLTSFGKYAFFTDRDPAGLYYVGGLNTYDGPVHMNESDNSPTDIVWTDGKPIFNFTGGDAFTYSGSINWHHNTTGSNQAPQLINNTDGSQTDQFLSVAKIGSPGISKVPKVVMPTTSYKQQYAALGLPMPTGANPGPPATAPNGGTPSGVIVTPGGGVYIHSANSADTNDVPKNSGLPVTDVQQMVLSVDGSGNQVITLQQPNDAGTLIQTQITWDRLSSVTHVQAGAYNPKKHKFSMAPLPDIAGVGNGVTYSDGNIGSTQSQGSGYVASPSSAPGKGLSGTIADNQALTIATYANPDQTNPNNKNINLNGSVAYKTPRAKDGTGAYLPETDPANQTFLQKAGTLGLVANTVQLVDNDASGSPLGDIELDATALVQNTLQTTDVGSYFMDTNNNGTNTYYAGSDGHGHNYYYHYLRTAHDFVCMGGEIASVEGGTGIFNGSTLQFIAGFNVHYSYDARLAGSPPPFFPTSGQYTVLSWQRVAAPL